MNVKRRLGRPMAAAATLLALVVGVGVYVVSDAPGVAHAAGTGPCDIYASGGTPCVAAHSTTRALYGAYNGPLYQVRRSSDNTTRDIGVLSAGGVRQRRHPGLVLRQHQLRHHDHLRPVRPQQPPHPGTSRRLRRAPPLADGTTSPTRRLRRSPSAARRRTASTSPPAPATATTTPTASRPATSPRASTRSSTARTTTSGAASTTATPRRTAWPTQRAIMETVYFGANKQWGYGAGSRPLDHGRPGVGPLLRGERGLQQHRRRSTTAS